MRFSFDPSSASNETTFLIQEGFFPSLNDQQNKIALVVFAVFGLLGACYAARRIRLKDKLNEKNPVELELTEISPLKLEEASVLNQDKKKQFRNFLPHLAMMAR